MKFYIELVDSVIYRLHSVITHHSAEEPKIKKMSTKIKTLETIVPIIKSTIKTLMKAPHSLRD